MSGGGAFDLVSDDFNEDGFLDFALPMPWEGKLSIQLATRNIANLQSMTLSGGAALDPAFHANTLHYTSNVTNTVYSIKVTPTLEDTAANMTVEVNGDTPVTVASGAESQELPLNVGLNAIKVNVTAQNGTTTKTYTFQVTRQQSTNANLSWLSLSGGATLDQVFHEDTLHYTSTVTNAVYSIKVTPALEDGTASMSVEVNGGTPVAVANGAESQTLPLNVGVNTIKVNVTAQDGTTKKTYTVVVTRMPETDDGAPSPSLSSNAGLSGLSIKGEAGLTPPFILDNLNYSLKVANAIASISVIPTLADIRATVTVGVKGQTPEVVTSGNASLALPLVLGTNTVEVTVKAQDGTLKVYSIVVTRQEAADHEPSQSVCPFTDIKGHWAEADICEAAGLGIVAGIDANRFVPDRAVTRAEFTVMLIRALQIPNGEQTEVQAYRDQTSIPDWALPAISTGTVKGIVSGYSEGSFGPEKLISREESAAMVVRAMKWDISGAGQLPFADHANISSWALPYVMVAYEHGLVQGRENNRFEPAGNMTRAEATVVLLRLWRTLD
jgi:translation elongation factor EF-1beta